MPIVRLSDARDLRVAMFRHLPRRQSPPGDGLVVSESPTAVERLLGSDARVVALLCNAEAVESLAGHPRVDADLPIYVASREVISEIVGFQWHRGVAAASCRPPRETLQVGHLQGEGRLAVIAEGISDPANLGALVRNCRAFAAHLLVVDRAGADPFSRRVIRASMGHVFTQPLWHTAVMGALDALRLLMPSARVIGTTPTADAIPLQGLRGAGDTIVLVGNEGSGLSPALLARSNIRVRIPMAEGVDSLNVASASAVLLWELTRGGLQTC